MCLQGPESPDRYHRDSSSQPKPTKGTMGDRQIIPYDPKIERQDPIERIHHIVQEKTDMFFRRALELEKDASQYLHQYGKGKIFVLLGHSTAGKTSIIHQLMNVNKEWLESGMDMDFPSQDADLLLTKEPELYTRMARAMDHTDIGHALQGSEPYWKLNISKEEKRDAQAALEETRGMVFDLVSQDADAVKEKVPELYARMAQGLEHSDIAIAIFTDMPPHWKSDISKEVQSDAEAALEEARKKKHDFPTKNAKMEDSVIENAIHGKSVIFDPYDEKAFLARMVKQNKYASIRIGLAYCPFPDLAERVKRRNLQASSRGRMDDYRPPLQPLHQFCDFYEAAKPGATVVDILHREEVEETIENAIQQQIKDINQGIGSAEELAELEKDRADIKQKLMEKLGFKPGADEVKITPSRNGRALQIDYLFRTNIMDPAAAAAIIREWK